VTVSTAVPGILLVASTFRVFVLFVYVASVIVTVSVWAVTEIVAVATLDESVPSLAT
jgi:hypothetical protein